jgi:hypothetical protein
VGVGGCERFTSDRDLVLNNPAGILTIIWSGLTC